VLNMVVKGHAAKNVSDARALLLAAPGWLDRHERHVVAADRSRARAVG
jgi:hypothetical protein